MAQLGNEVSVADLFYGSVTLGERGQVVIPAEARKQHGLHPGDKLLVFRQPHGQGLMLARVEDVRAVVEALQQVDELFSKVGENHDEEPNTDEGD